MGLNPPKNINQSTVNVNINESPAITNINQSGININLSDPKPKAPININNSSIDIIL